MSEHLTQNQIEGYGRRTLSTAELLSASDHLGACEPCRRRVERALDGDAAFLALKSDVLGEAAEMLSPPLDRMHLTFEQTAAYVDGALAGEELQATKDHLTCCVQCDLAVNDLRVFRDQVAPELIREYKPLLVGNAIEKPRNRFVTAMSALLPRPHALIFGTALTALMLIAIGWVIWLTLQPNEKKPDLTRATPSPTIPVVTPVVSPTPPAEAPVEMVLAQLNDGGGEVTLNRDGKLSGLDHLPPAYQRMIRETLTNQQLEKSPLLAGLTRPGSSEMRGGNNQENKFSVTEPIGKVMLSNRPTFRWSQLEGATSYIVEVYDEKFTLVTTSPQLINNSWTPSQSLKRGGIYAWQVKALKDGQELIAPRSPAPQAKFRILDEAKTNELMQARRTYASSHLTLGVLYTQAGLLDEAEREMRALHRANPNSTIARRLLSNAQAMRH